MDIRYGVNISTYTRKMPNGKEVTNKGGNHVGNIYFSAVWRKYANAAAKVNFQLRD